MLSKVRNDHSAASASAATAIAAEETLLYETMSALLATPALEPS